MWVEYLLTYVGFSLLVILTKTLLIKISVFFFMVMLCCRWSSQTCKKLDKFLLSKLNKFSLPHHKGISPCNICITTRNRSKLFSIVIVKGLNLFKIFLFDLLLILGWSMAYIMFGIVKSLAIVVVESMFKVIFVRAEM